MLPPTLRYFNMPIIITVIIITIIHFTVNEDAKLYVKMNVDEHTIERMVFFSKI